MYFEAAIPLLMSEPKKAQHHPLHSPGGHPGALTGRIGKSTTSLTFSSLQESPSKVVKQAFVMPTITVRIRTEKASCSPLT